MERTFKYMDDVLSLDALRDITSIRNSYAGTPMTLKHEVIHCPVCKKEAGKIGRKRAFCPECLREFTIGTSQLEQLKEETGTFAVCITCGNLRSNKRFNKAGECDICRDLRRNYIEGTCSVCGKAKPVHKQTLLCMYHHKDRKRG